MAQDAVTVRAAEPADLDLLAGIEWDADQLYVETFGVAGTPFAWVPMTGGADRAAVPGFLLVAGEPVVGFAHVVEADGQAHLEQLSVLRSHQQRGIGSALLRAALAEAARRGHAELSLCTYADLPWNAPYYRRFGFVERPAETPFHRRLQADEEAEGLARHGRRVLMVAPTRRVEA